MDISGAYSSAELDGLERSFSFTESSVTMTDKIRYSGEEAITERFVTLDKPEVGGGRIDIKDGAMLYPSKYTPEVEEVILNAEATSYLINFKLEKGEELFTITLI